MNKIKILLTAIIISIASTAFAETPPMVAVVPTQRYIFNDSPFDCENGYKLDTRTGEFWEIRKHWSPEKVKIIKFTGIGHPSEADSYDGRFSFKVLASNGHPWVYVFDSKTGNLWTCRIGKADEVNFHLVTK